MKKTATNRSSEVHLGFQIAPMIDVVFVILLYFIIMVGAVQKETAHNTKLPSNCGLSVETPDEIAIRIEEDGQVYLNDDPLDLANEGALVELTENLKQLKTGSDSSSSEVLVTIYAADSARYQRMMDVLDSLGEARIENVTFQSGSME